MNRTSLIAAVLSAIVLVTLPAPPVDAGGGMGGGTGTTGCRVIQGGPNPPQVVALADTFASETVVQVGPAALVCDIPITGRTIGGGPATSQVPENPNALVCYPVLGSDKEKFTVSITDTFTLVNGPSGNSTIAGLRLLCVVGVIGPPQQ